jgi:parallel beta-helix repeat protein
MIQQIDAQETFLNCITSTGATPTSSTNGLYKPSNGQMHVLYIYAQFPDDNYQSGNQNWPVNQPPVLMNNSVDETWSTSPTPGTATEYFNEASFDQFKFTGKEYFVIAPHTRQWYLDNNKTRYHINREVIEELDNTISFSEFDRWDYISTYNHVESADEFVDFIVIIWRNISMDLSNEDYVYNTFQFGNYGDLGWGANYFVDNGSKEINPFWTSGSGGGATLTNAISGNKLRSSIHEYAHYLLGNNDHHNGFSFWAMLDDWGARSNQINYYERDRLGWTPESANIYEIDNSTQTTSVTLRDFATTGDAVRIATGTSNEYFIIENHQRISSYDVPDLNSSQTGIYVYHQHGSRGNDVTFIPADGRYNWPIVEFTDNIWGNNPSSQLPVRYKAGSNPIDGYFDTEKLPYSWNGGNYKVQINFIKNFITGENEHVTYYKGDGKDAYDLGYNDVFSPWSNSNSQKWNKTPSGIGFEITSKTDGVYTLNVHINTTINAKPSKPMSLRSTNVNNHPNIEWDAALEPDFSKYHIMKKTGAGGSWLTIASIYDQGTTTYIDNGETYYLGTSPTNEVFYKVRVMDDDNKYSVFSDEIRVHYDGGNITIGGPGQEISFNQDISVASNSTLTIGPGSKIRLGYYNDIIINDGASIIAEGTQSNPITFEKSGGSNWGYITLKGDNNYFKHCIFDDGQINLYLDGSTGNTFENCVFKNASTGFYAKNSSEAYIKNCESFNNATGFYFFSNNEIYLTGNEIYNNDAGVYATNSNVVNLYGNIIQDNISYGVKVNGGSVVNIGKVYTWPGYNTIRNNVSGYYNNFDVYASGSGTDLDLCYACVYSDNCDGAGLESCPNDGFEISNAPTANQMYVQSCWYGEDEVCQYNDNGSYSFMSPLTTKPTSWIGITKDDDPSPYFPKMSIPGDDIPDKYRGLQGLISLKEKMTDNTIPVKEKRAILGDIYSMQREDYRMNSFGERDNFYNFLEKEVLKINDPEIVNMALQFQMIWKSLEKNYEKSIELSERLISRVDESELMHNLINLAHLFQSSGRKYEASQVLKMIIDEYGTDNIDVSILIEELGIPDAGIAKYSISDEQNLIPSEFLLSQNYPNPFNPLTTIEYGLPNENHVILSIYNTQGHMVKELVNDFKSAGLYKVSFDGSNLSSGVYFYRIKAGGFTDVKRMVLIK